MKPVLAGHPMWRQLLIITGAFGVVIVAAVIAFAWPAARIAPRDLPLGVVGSDSTARQIVTTLTDQQPGGFDLRLYADEQAARTAIEHRDVYGAIVVAAPRVTVLEASAASPTVAQLLTTTGQHIVAGAAQQARGQTPLALHTVDVVAQPAGDSRGAVLSSALLPLTICGVVIAVAVGLAVRLRPAWRQLVGLVVVSAVGGAGAYLIAQTWLGALPQHGAADWGVLALTLLAISSATAGLIALAGFAGAALAGALMVFVGNPFSGVTSAPELLPDTVGHIGQALPPGAGANLLRSAAFFDGNGGAGHLTVLIVWVVAGFAAIVVGHHTPIPFAASSRRRTADSAPTTESVLPVPAEAAAPSGAVRHLHADHPRHLLPEKASTRSAPQ